MFLVMFFGLMFLTCALCRRFMFLGLRQGEIPEKLKWRCSLTGAAREIVLLGLAFALCFNIYMALLPVGLEAFAAGLLSLLTVFVFLINIVDAAVYQQATRRLDNAVFANTNLISIRAVFHWREVAVLVISLLVLGLLGYGVWWGMMTLRPADSWTALASLALSGILWHFTRHIRVSKEDFIPGLHYELDWVNMKIGMFMADDVQVIMRPAGLCFAEIFFKKTGFGQLKLPPLTPGEKEQLCKLFLLREAPVPRVSFTPKRYKRVVIIEIESLARNLLPMYNPKIPKETTPFLGYIHRKFHHVDNYYATSSPTELAMTAMLGSRLPESWNTEDVNIDTLFGMLRPLGYTSYYMHCTTGYYNNHHKKNPAVLKTDCFVADEQLKQDFPDDPRNTWGYGDATLYKKALQVLEKHRDDPVCVVVSTVNTHAPHWYSYESFPASIEATDSALLRSLYQMDSELSDFFAAFRQQGFFDDDTLLCITADHNPHFGKEYPEFTGESYYPNLIPLYFLTTQPGPFQAIPSQTLTCQLDFLPTFCEAMGMSAPRTALGDSMFNVPKRRFIMQQYHPTRVDVSTFGFHFSVSDEAQGTTAKELLYQKWLVAKLRAAGAI